MLQVRFHGRGGQGVVTAAELLSVAAFLDGHEAQAFPSFGSERMGAPVAAFCRISDTPIRLREPVTEPDVVVVVDATLLHHVDVFAGLAPDVCLLGALASLTRCVSLTAIEAATAARFDEHVAVANSKAARAAYTSLRVAEGAHRA